MARKASSAGPGPVVGARNAEVSLGDPSAEANHPESTCTASTQSSILAGMRKKVRIVSIRSYPDDSQKADADKESKALNAGGFSIEGYAEQAITALADTLTRAGGDDRSLEVVLHLSMHGMEDGRLVFVRDDLDFRDATTGEPATIDGLATLISRFRSIRGVVLSACHSDSVAKALVSSKPATQGQHVIEFAMGFKGVVADSAANTFVRVFYAQLASGQSLAEAAERARATLAASEPEKQYADRVALYSRDEAATVFVPSPAELPLPKLSFVDDRGNEVRDWTWLADGLAVKLDAELPRTPSSRSRSTTATSCL